MKTFFLTILICLFPIVATAQHDDDSDDVVSQECAQWVPVDNCPGTYNPEQGDCDSDGTGDACDETHGCSDTSLDTDTGPDSDPGLDTGADTDSDTGTDLDFFTIVMLPDTQAYISWKPAAFYEQTEWIANNADEYNIKFVVHVGDVVGSVNSDAQWSRAVTAMQTLDDIAMPYSISHGNHDGDGRDTTNLNTYFPLSLFETMPTYGGTFEAGNVDNTYYSFSVGGYDYLILSLEFGPRDNTLDWAEDIILLHPDHHVIIATHSYLNSDGERAADGDSHNPRFYGLGEYNDGQLMWDEMLKFQDNVDLVLCGHVGAEEGSALLTSTTDSGKTVHQMLANYQYLFSTSYRGALRILKFYPGENRLEASTYSPYRDMWFSNAENEFELIF